MDKIKLDNYIRRLIEVQTELGSMNDAFNEQQEDLKQVRKSENPIQQLTEVANKYRVPGFQAYHLALEGYSLLNLIALGIALLKKTTDPELAEQLKVTEQVINETEPLLLTTLDHMGPFRTLDLDEIIKNLEDKVAN